MSICYAATKISKQNSQGGGGLLRSEAHHETEIVLRQVYHGRVEIGTLVEGVGNNAGRQGRGGLEKVLR